MKIFNDHKGTYGRKRIKQALEEEYFLVVNEKRVARLMRKYGLVCKIRRKRFKHQNQPVGDIPNILNQNFKAMKPKIKLDRKSTRLNSSHVAISYAVFCLKEKRA